MSNSPFIPLPVRDTAGLPFTFGLNRRRGYITLGGEIKDGGIVVADCEASPGIGRYLVHAGNNYPAACELLEKAFLVLGRTPAADVECSAAYNAVREFLAAAHRFAADETDGGAR